MPRVIKANMVNIAQEPMKVEVPDLSQLNMPPVQPVQELEGGFMPTDFGGMDGAQDMGEGAELSAGEQERPQQMPMPKESPLKPEEAMKNATENAALIVENAKKEAERIIAEAHEEAEYEAENLFERAKDNGYEAGYKEGGVVAENMLADAKQTILKAQQEREDILKGLEPQIIQFILDVVEKLCGSGVKPSSEVLLHLIKTGLEGEAGADSLEIRVSKEDYPEANKMKDEIQAMVDSDTAVTVIKDAALKSGDCVIDTPIGSIDCSFSTQWNLLKAEILLILNSR